MVQENESLNFEVSIKVFLEMPGAECFLDLVELLYRLSCFRQWTHPILLTFSSIRRGTYLKIGGSPT